MPDDLKSALLAFAADVARASARLAATLVEAPSEPAPIEPVPVEPAPTPVDPVPVDQTPVEPAPVDPAPSDPAPVDPVPTPPVIGRTVATDAADLQAKLAAAVDGDTIGLKGEFGDVVINNVNKSVRIVGEALDQAHFDKLRTAKSSGLTFENFTVYPRQMPVQVPKVKSFAVQVDSGSDLTFDGLLIRGREDSDAFENWTFQDWTDWRMGGVWTRGARCRILNTRAIGVQGGMSIAGVGSEIRNSRVEGFSDDGMRINASDCGIYDSWISDRVKINEDHPDGIQIFGPAGTVLRNAVVSGVTIRDRARAIGNALWTYLQGIGLFNGPYENILIESVDAQVSSYHGITVGNVDGLVIRNNTIRPGHSVIKPGYPHIAVTMGKGGEAPRNVQVYDNSAPKFTLGAVAVDQLTAYNNVTV